MLKMPLITVCYKKSEERIKELKKLFKSNPEIFGSQFNGSLEKYNEYIHQEFTSSSYHSVDRITEEIKELDPPILNGQYNTRLVEVDLYGNILQTLKVYNNGNKKIRFEKEALYE